DAPASPVTARPAVILALLPLPSMLGAFWGSWPLFATSFAFMVVGTVVVLRRDLRELRRMGKAPQMDWLGFLTSTYYVPAYLRRRERLTGTGRGTTWCWFAAVAVRAGAMISVGAWSRVR